MIYHPSDIMLLVTLLFTVVVKLFNSIIVHNSFMIYISNVLISENQISEKGIIALSTAVGYQTTIAHDPSSSRIAGCGLKRLCVEVSKQEFIFKTHPFLCLTIIIP